MKFLKAFFAFFSICFLIWACGSSNIKSNNNITEKPVVIANDSLEYEIIIIDPGFNLFLNSVAQPRGFYSQNYLENKNNIFVTNWNLRVRNPNRFDSSIYENIIDYSPHINYGYEVNYQLFNYFMFAQRKYKMRLDNAFSNRIR